MWKKKNWPKLNLFQKIFANQKIALFIGSLDKFFIKLPHLPKKIRLLINRIVPFVALLFGLVGLIASVLAGSFVLLGLLAGEWVFLAENSFNFGLTLLSALLLLKAFKPLRAGNAVGWIYLFWAELLEVVNLITRAINREDNLLLGLAVILISFYLLFEIGQFYVYKKEEEKLNTI